MAADVVLDWNLVALSAIKAANTAPPVAARMLAILHTSVYDAVNAIDRTHKVYRVEALAPPTASREAAAAQAAFTVLSALLPSQQAAYDAALASSLAAVPDGANQDAGVALGTYVAAQMLALRSNDGSGASVTYTPGGNPGDWQPTPPAFANPALPHWGDVTPFAMTSGSQFTPHGIPALSSAEYAAAFNEVKDLGSAGSVVRTADQTNMAKFWANGAGTTTPPGHLNRLATVVAEARNNTLSQNARLFAMLNVALVDASIMAWDAKYSEDFWRPITAIRAADTDGNAATAQDATWTPLLTTPNHPSYVSGHASFSGAAAAVLAAFFGTDNVSFTLESEDNTVADRSFTSFSQAAEESAASRMLGGIHWRFDNEDGLTAGEELGQYVARTQFTRASFGPSAGVVNGNLIIYGSQGRDNFTFEVSSNRLIVRNGRRLVGSFDQSSIQLITVDAGAGDDKVHLGDDIAIRAILFGGAGNDTLYGGRLDDQLFGGMGKDTLYGLGGDDELDGGLHDDLLMGGAGIDLFRSSPGRDRNRQ